MFEDIYFTQLTVGEQLEGCVWREQHWTVLQHELEKWNRNKGETWEVFWKLLCLYIRSCQRERDEDKRFRCIATYVYVFYPPWLYFCAWCQLVVEFIFLHVALQVSQHHLLKRLFLLHFMLLAPLSNINWSQRLGFISRFSILFHWSMFLLLCQYQTVLITAAL